MGIPQPFIFYIFITILPLVIAALLTGIVIKFAKKLNWISIPRNNRWHIKPVALMGGVAIFSAFSITSFFYLDSSLWALWIGGVIMFVVGFWDDQYELKPLTKFLFQFITASLLVSTGLLIGVDTWPLWLSFPLTIVWIIGLTNAINFLDNMDGLAAGTALLISLVLGFLALKFGDAIIATSAFIMGGSIAGFLIFNFKPAKIFMGDCGSLFIGFMLAGLSLTLSPYLVTAAGSISIIPVLVAVMILPIFDTTLITFLRTFKGRSLSQGGRDHSSHRLVFLGLSETKSVLILYGLSAIFGFITILLFPQQLLLFYSLITIGFIGLAFFGKYLTNVDVYRQEHLSSIEQTMADLPDYVKNKVQLATIMLDIILIVVSITLAHYLRFEGWNNNIEASMTAILPGVIIIKVLFIAAFGLYNSVWKHAGVADLVRINAAAFVGAVATGIFAWLFYGGYISISVFAIDYLLLFFLLAGSRFAYKGLRRLFAITNKKGKNLLIYGASDAGWLALSEIRQNSEINLKPVGFIDDSPYIKKRYIQGITVLGNWEDVEEIILNYEIEELLICIKDISAEEEDKILKTCQLNAINCSKFKTVFNTLKKKEQERKAIGFTAQA